MTRLTDDELARKVTRYEAMKRALILFTAVVVTASLVILAVIAVQNRVTLQTIRDCTEQGGKCNARGQEQTASAVADINRVVILAAACASGLPLGLSVDARESRIQFCVIQRLADVPEKQ
jgi:hypothetical protein